MSSNFSRRPEESEYEYIYRIATSKDAIGSWQDVADLLNAELGYEYTESKYRKDFASFKKMFEANRALFSDFDAQAKDLSEKEIAFKIEARKFYDQRQALNRVVTRQAREEQLQNCVEAAAAQINNLFPLLPETISKPIDPHQNEAILCLADWHYGMVCDHVFNQYNPDVCRNRVRRLTDMVKEKMWLHGVSHLHVLLLGDFAHGAIHPTVRLESSEKTCDQLMQVSELLAEMLNELSFGVAIDVYATYGNHMRTIQNKKESIHSDNMERIIPWWLKERLQYNASVKVHPAGDEFIKLEICGEGIVATHGDLDKVRDFGVTASMLFAKSMSCPISYAIMADKHHIEGLDRFGVESIVVPSLCGSDDHAHSKRLYSKPGQTMMLFNPSYGRDAIYQFKL